MSDSSEKPPSGQIPTDDVLLRMGFKTIGEVPSEDSTVQDLLLYALTPFGGHKPQWGMVLTAAAELEMVSRFADGPLQVFLGNLSRRLRTAVDLDKRIESERRAGAKR